jgi:hypothetical protein
MPDLIEDTDDGAESIETFRFRIANISPTPSKDVVAAITAALNEAWPQPVTIASAVPASDVNWRFGQRRWRDRQIPRQTWGRTG